MSISQLVYAVTPSGWQISQKTGRITQSIESRFESMWTVVPKTDTYALDYSSRLYVLSRAIPTGKDPQGRNAGLIHGYIFIESQWEELFSNYAGLLGVDGFVSQYDEKLAVLTELSTCAFTPQLAADFNLPGLMACVYKALAEAKRLIVCTPADDEKRTLMRSVLYAIYATLPLSLRRFITFESRVTGRGRKISFSSNIPQDGSLYFDVQTGQSSIVEPCYRELAQIACSFDESFFEAANTIAAGSFERWEYADEAAREIVEKLLLGYGCRKIEPGEEQKYFDRIIASEQFKDPVYAEVLTELLGSFLRNNTYDAQHFDRVMPIYSKLPEKKHREDVLAFVLEACQTAQSIDYERVFRNAKEYADFYLDFLTELFGNERYAALGIHYLNLCLASAEASITILELLHTPPYAKVLALWKSFMKSNLGNVSLCCKEILQQLAEYSEALYREMENELFNTGKSEIVVQLYNEYFLSKAQTCEDILKLCEKLEAAGADFKAFVKASASRFVELCINENSAARKNMDQTIAKVCAYLKKAQLDPEVYLVKIYFDYKQKYWKHFSWETCNFSEDLSDLYDERVSKSKEVKPVLDIVQAIANNVPLCTTALPFVDVACTDKYLSPKEKRIVAERIFKLSGGSTDVDVRLFLYALCPKKYPMKEMLMNYDGLEEYCASCVKEVCETCTKETCEGCPDGSRHMTDDGDVLIALYRFVVRTKKTQPDRAEQCDRILNYLMRYASIARDEKVLRTIKSAKRTPNYSKISLCALILSVFCILKLMRLVTSSLYLHGVGDTLGIIILIVACVIDAIWPPKEDKHNIISLLINGAFAAIIGVLLFCLL